MPLNEKGEYEAPEDRVPGPMPVEEPIIEQPKAPDLSPVIETQSKLAQTIEALNRSVTGGQESARLLADPVIRDYLTAKANGKKVKLVDEAALAQETGKEDPPPDFETMKNGELVQWMMSQLDKRSEQRAKTIAEQQIQALKSEISPHLEGLKAHASQAQAEKVNAEVREMKEKYKDFDALRNEMLETNKTVEGLSLEELYILTKKRKGLPLIPQPEVSTERPSQLPGGRNQVYARPRDITGKRGFSAILDSALKADDRD